MAMLSPVRELRPVRVARVRVVKLPKPAMATVSFLASASPRREHGRDDRVRGYPRDGSLGGDVRAEFGLVHEAVPPELRSEDHVDVVPIQRDASWRGSQPGKTRTFRLPLGQQFPRPRTHPVQFTSTSIRTGPRPMSARLGGELPVPDVGVRATTSPARSRTTPRSSAGVASSPTGSRVSRAISATTAGDASATSLVIATMNYEL